MTPTRREVERKPLSTRYLLVVGRTVLVFLRVSSSPSSLLPVVFCVHDELLDELPLQRVQDLALRAARHALDACFGDCGLDVDTDGGSPTTNGRIAYHTLAAWLTRAPKSPYCLWLHLLDLESGSDEAGDESA